MKLGSLRFLVICETQTLRVPLPQVSGRHADVPAVQQGLDQGEDLRSAPASGPAGGQMKLLRAGGAAARGHAASLSFVLCMQWNCILYFII